MARPDHRCVSMPLRRAYVGFIVGFNTGTLTLASPMIKNAPNLTVRGIDAAAPRETVYRLSGGGGLLLEVRPTGAKLWFARVTVAGKRRDMGLGGYPDVSLKDARQKADEARRQAKNGIDPIAHRKMAAKVKVAEADAAQQAEARTFAKVVKLFISAEAPSWKNKRTELLWQKSLEKWAYPVLGSMPVATIDRKAVYAAIEPVWTTRPATGKKVLRRIGAVLRYAAANGWRVNDNVTDIKMLRHIGLPALAGGRKQPSLPWSRVPAFMTALDGISGLGALALRLVILTALRSGEIRAARWSWLSFDGIPTLNVPGEVMKAKKSTVVELHRVPLAPAAIDALARAHAMANGTETTSKKLAEYAAKMGNSLIFPSSKLTTPLSDMVLSAVIRRMNANQAEGVLPPWRDADGREAVPHGFRASFSTWVDDTRPEDREAAERALAHEVANKVSGAYRRSDLFDRRVPLMEAWAKHCCAIVSSYHSESEGKTNERTPSL